MESHSNQNPRYLFAAIDKLILKFIQKWKGPRIAKANLEKNKVEGLTQPDLKTSLELQDGDGRAPAHGPHGDPEAPEGSPDAGARAHRHRVPRNPRSNPVGESLCNKQC